MANRPFIRKLTDLVISERISAVRLDERSQERIRGYADNVDNLPAIVIDQDNNILDGFHRYHAHKLAERHEIKCIVKQAETDKERYLLAVSMNAGHGLGLTTAELKHNAIELYRLNATDREIAEAIKRSEATVHAYIKEEKAAWKAKQIKIAHELYSKKSLTQQEIADYINCIRPNSVTQRTVSEYLKRKLPEPSLAPEIKAVTDAKPTIEPEAQKRVEAESAIDEDDKKTDEESERIHSEMQWMLLWLGNELNLNLWLPKTDLTQSHKKNEIVNLAGKLKELPFDILKAGRSVQRIDVLWLKDNKIIAAFEIEHSTGIESGLFRMSHMWVSLEDLSIRTYIVAPDTDVYRAQDKISEPTFMHNGLAESCWFVPYTKLANKYNGAEQNGSVSKDWQGLLDEIGYKL